MPLTPHTYWVLEAPPELSRAPQDPSLTWTAPGHPAPRVPLRPASQPGLGEPPGPVSPQTWGPSPREVACQDSMCVWRPADPPRWELPSPSPWGGCSPSPMAGGAWEGWALGRKDPAPPALQVPELCGWGGPTELSVLSSCRWPAPNSGPSSENGEPQVLQGWVLGARTGCGLPPLWSSRHDLWHRMLGLLPG